MPSSEQRDLRTLLRDRHQWVRIRTRVQNTLQAIALNHALRKGRRCGLQRGRRNCKPCLCPPTPVKGGTNCCAYTLQLQQRIQELDGQVEEQAQQRPQALRLLTHPGVGPVTALATEVFLGDPSRFANGKK